MTEGLEGHSFKVVTGEFMDGNRSKSNQQKTDFMKGCCHKLQMRSMRGASVSPLRGVISSRDLGLKFCGIADFKIEERIKSLLSRKRYWNFKTRQAWAYWYSYASCNPWITGCRAGCGFG